jgi:hypothetical protein
MSLQTKPSAPFEFFCSLSHQLMADPVLSIHGCTFERQAILTWLDMGYDICPVTAKPMSLGDIISDKKLRSKIQRWREENGHGDVKMDFCLEEHMKSLGFTVIAAIPTTQLKNKEADKNKEEVPNKKTAEKVRVATLDRLRNALKKIGTAAA